MRAKKSLGQHFLTARSVVNEIVRAGTISEDDTVLEIGPGRGILTEALLNTGVAVIAVEKDAGLASTLQDKFSTQIRSGKLKLILGDILNLDLSHHNLKTKGYKLIANIPYYITGEIFRKFIGGKNKPSRAVLLVQREVADRILARNGKESILSISVKAYGYPKIIKRVSAKAFTPPPKVDSAVLLIENIQQNFPSDGEEGHFFEILRAGFAHKRKRLAKNLSNSFVDDQAGQIMSLCGISKNARAEDLTLGHWRCLANSISI